MERPLYQKVRTTSLQNSTIEIGTGDVDSKLLADHPFIDTVLLTQRVLASLGAGEQVGLNQVIDETPLDEGLAEVIAYLTLADESLDVDISEQDRTELSWTESTWPHGVAPDADDVEDVDEVVLRVLDLPAVTFKRTPGGPS